MGVYRKILSFLAQAEAVGSAAVLGVMVAINFMEITSRFVFHHSFIWVQELSILLVCWLVYLGAAYIYCTADLLKVDFLYDKTQGILRLLWNILVHTAIFLVLLTLVVYGWKFTAIQNQARSSILHVSNSLLTIPLLICSCTMLLKLVDRVAAFVGEFRDRKGRAPQ